MTSHTQAALPPKTAVLLVNLGSPDAPTPQAIARYLGEFLSDRLVVNIPKLAWYPILYGIILRVRPKKLAPLYAHIWQGSHDNINGAPLKAITQNQAVALNALIEKSQNNANSMPVYWAMRYQNPSLSSVLAQIKADGFDKVRILPLYPQYSHTTTGTVTQAIDNVIKKHKLHLDVEYIPPYPQHPAYIQALKSSIHDYWAAHGTPDFANGDKLLLSFHGLPKVNIQKGDPYQAHCEQTVAALKRALNLPADAVHHSFQSRFGAQKWIGPATATQLQKWGSSKQTQRVDVICPGFSADCLETLEEVAGELKDIFASHASTTAQYHYIPCLNALTQHIDMMHQMILDN